MRGWELACFIGPAEEIFEVKTLRNGFVEFGKRTLDLDEVDFFPSKHGEGIANALDCTVRPHPHCKRGSC